MTNDKLTGIDFLRAAVKALDHCREDFLSAVRDPYTAEQLLDIYRAWRRSDWDIYPDTWEPRQLREAIGGLKVVPRWREDEHGNLQAVYND